MSGYNVLACIVAAMVLASLLRGLVDLVGELRATWLFHRRLVALEKRLVALIKELDRRGKP